MSSRKPTPEQPASNATPSEHQSAPESSSLLGRFSDAASAMVKPASDTRSKILDAARDLFVSLGYARVTMRKIAENVGYTPTTIYLHFKDKDALLRELVAGDFFAMSAKFKEVRKVADPFERLRAMGMAYIEYGLAFPNHYKLIFLTSSNMKLEDAVDREGHRGDPEYDAYAALMHTIEACIKSGRVRPEYTDAELGAQMLWSAVHGIVSLYISKSHDPWFNWKPPMETAAALFDSLERGLTISDEEFERKTKANANTNASAQPPSAAPPPEHEHG